MLPGNIIKVDGFLNHRIDTELMEHIAEEFGRRFDMGAVEWVCAEKSPSNGLRRWTAIPPTATTSLTPCTALLRRRWRREPSMKCDKKYMLLYAVTDRTWVGEKTLYQQVEEALRGGVTCVQLREKDMGDEDFLQEAKEIHALCQQIGRAHV